MTRQLRAASVAMTQKTQDAMDAESYSLEVWAHRLPGLPQKEHPQSRIIVERLDRRAGQVCD